MSFQRDLHFRRIVGATAQVGSAQEWILIYTHNNGPVSPGVSWQEHGQTGQHGRKTERNATPGMKTFPHKIYSSPQHGPIIACNLRLQDYFL
jgi:hypothetical protein